MERKFEYDENEMTFTLKLSREKVEDALAGIGHEVQPGTWWDLCGHVRDRTHTESTDPEELIGSYFRSREKIQERK